MDERIHAALRDSDLPDILIRDHLDRMEPSYFKRYPLREVRSHLEMIHRLGAERPIEVKIDPLDKDEWKITIVAFDYMAEVSAISGLFVAYGLSVITGDVYTYISRPSALSAPSHPAGSVRRRHHGRRASHPAAVPSPPLLALRKIVDIFHVRSLHGALPDWKAFEQDMGRAVSQLKEHRDDEVYARINLRVVDYLRKTTGARLHPLYPVHITVDNTAPAATSLLIEGQDTPAFLYALLTALSLRGVNITRLAIDTLGDEVRDTVTITDRQGRKITDPEKIRELKSVVALIKQFTHLLIRAPDPSMALAHFNQLIDKILANVRSPREMEETCLLLEKRPVIDAMARLFGASEFLWEDFLRMQYKNLFPVLQDVQGLDVRKPRDRLERELTSRLDRISGFARKRDTLNRYKDREMFRIDMRQIISDANETLLTEFSRELTDLAEVVLEAAYRFCDVELRRRHGRPMLSSGEECGLCICALGKCGGRELGWASDIELLFVYTDQGITDGAHPLHNSEYYEHLVRKICDAVTARREGIFEIDLRLRPYGSKGPLACSFAHFHEYFTERGGALPYERQALIKLRAIGGDRALGRRIEAARDAFVFSPAPLDQKELTRLRERQNDELVRPGAVNVKYSYGGVIDIEYYVQYMQIIYGAANPDLRSPNTLEALEALHHAGHIPAGDYRRLRDAYHFLRRLINALRIVRGNARDLVLPDRRSQEFRFLARRLGYSERQGADPAEGLARDVRQHVEWATRAHRTRFLHTLFR